MDPRTVTNSIHYAGVPIQEQALRQPQNAASTASHCRSPPVLFSFVRSPTPLPPAERLQFFSAAVLRMLVQPAAHAEGFQPRRPCCRQAARLASTPAFVISASSSRSRSASPSRLSRKLRTIRRACICPARLRKRPAISSEAQPQRAIAAKVMTKIGRARLLRMYDPAAGLTRTPQHGDDILREQERSNSANVICRTASPWDPPDTRLLGSGWLTIAFGPALCSPAERRRGHRERSCPA